MASKKRKRSTRKPTSRDPMAGDVVTLHRRQWRVREIEYSYERSAFGYSRTLTTVVLERKA